MNILHKKIEQWAKDKNLLKPENAQMQMLKCVSEVGELADALIKKDNPEIIDGLGDTVITLIILAKQLGLDLNECTLSAYNEIENRKGETKNGVFIKEK